MIFLWPFFVGRWSGRNVLHRQSDDRVPQMSPDSKQSRLESHREVEMWLQNDKKSVK